MQKQKERRWRRCVWVQRRGVGLPMKQWYHFVYIIVGGVHWPGVGIKRRRRVRCERVCYAHRSQHRCSMSEVKNYACTINACAPQELSLGFGLGSEGVVLDWTDLCAKILYFLSVSFPTKPDGRRGYRELSVSTG